LFLFKSKHRSRPTKAEEQEFQPTRTDVSLQGKELVDLVAGAPFRIRLAQAARITNRTGHETTFRYYRDITTAQSVLTPVFEGGCTNTDPESRLYFSTWLEGQFDAEAREAVVLDFHFHPDPSGDHHLSLADLSFLDHDFEPCARIKHYWWRSVIVMGMVDYNLRGNLLLMQKESPAPIMDSSIFHELWDKLRRYAHLWPQSDFGRYVEVKGYVKADVLDFFIPLRSRSASYASLEPLLRFAETSDPNSR